MIGFYFPQEGTQPVTGAHSFARDHFFASDIGLGIVTQINVNTPSLGALDDTHHQLTHSVLKCFDDTRAFRLADFLYDYLLCGLRCDTPKIYRFYFILYPTTEFEFRIIFLGSGQGNLPQRKFLLCIVFDDLPATEGFIVAGLAIDLHSDFDILATSFARSGRKGSFERIENYFFVDTFLVRDGVHDQ